MTSGASRSTPISSTPRQSTSDQYRPFQPILSVAGLSRFGISLEEASTCKPLKNSVHSYLQIKVAKPISYAVIPDGTQAVFISPQGSIISGAQSQACDVPILESGDYFGIRFFPGALRHFFDLNLYDITDQFTDSGYFPCANFQVLHHTIYEQDSFRQRANVCEQWLLQHYHPQPVTPFDLALSLIYQSFGNIKISELATKTEWTSRHLIRQFRKHTGLSTKTFSQIIRIQHACRQLCIKPSGSSTTALDLGFFDQAHLLNDYKKRLLSNPSEFFDRFRSDFSNP
ncbi:MAG: helix-turn-helix domain-containing protein [Pseudomonadales bacterium]|nr:helix-turn-helix domain-containing protein [Pseudomonadales bacterium]